MMNCPICNSINHKQVFKKLTKGITSDSNFIDGEISNVICTTCGHVFNETGARNDVVSFYTESYRLMDLSPEAEFKFYSDEGSISYSDWRLNILVENYSLGKTGKILDIGCGKGNFLQRFSKKFPNWILYGIEASENALKFAKKKLSTAQFYEGLFTHDPFGEKFDLIVSLGVIEHLEDPNSFLQLAKSCLKENGIFLFDIPNFKLNPADFYIFDHLNHFTNETLQNLLKKNNLEVIQIIESENRVPMFIICKKNNKLNELVNYYHFMNKLCEKHIEFNESLMDTYHNVNEKFDKIAVFGLGIMIWAGIQNNKIQKNKIISFFDENDFLIGKEKNGIKIKSIDEIINYKKYPIVFSLSPCYIENVSKKFNKLEVNCILPSNYNYYKKFL